jgi:hypothetical protein
VVGALVEVNCILFKPFSLEEKGRKEVVVLNYLLLLLQYCCIGEKAAILVAERQMVNKIISVGCRRVDKSLSVGYWRILKQPICMAERPPP